MSDTQPQSQTSNESTSYADGTNRIQAWSDLLKSVTPYIWVAVVLIVVIPLIGRGLMAGAIQPTSTSEEAKEAVVVVERNLPNPNELDRAIVTALRQAKMEAKGFASEQLDAWVAELIDRVDTSFIPWYFNYLNQKKIEFSTPFIYLSSAVKHWVNTNNSPPKQVVAEKFTEDFQAEFAKRVLRPQIAQLELERMTRDTVTRYIYALENNISEIQSSYQIPQGNWERYLGDIAVTVNNNGNMSTLSLKVLVGGGSYLLVKGMIPVATKVGSKVVTAFAGKAAAKMAAKTGGTVAAKVGAEFLDPIVGVGIIIWDLWDYQHTVNVSKPILRGAILDYLQEIKASLIDDFDDGIMASIYQLEGSILKSVQSVSSPVL